MNLRLMSVVCAVAILALNARAARADDDLRDDDRDKHKVSITFAPILLTVSTVELLGEFRLARKGSLAAIAAYGRPNGVSLWEVGGQGRYYLLGGFQHGLNIGGEALLIEASSSSGSLTATASGVAAGVFVGYKFAAQFGLTFDIHAGYRMLGIGASGSDSDTGRTASVSSGPKGAVLLRLNAGWSF